MPDRSPVLTPESRPLKLHQMDAVEIEFLQGLNRSLANMENELTATTSQACMELPWATIDERRVPRTIMIDGPRGSGKTSLMLTFIQACLLASERRPSQSQEWWRGDGLGHHRVLPIADLHPMPKDIPIYAWLMEPFGAVARWVDAKRAGRGRGEDDETLHGRLRNVQQGAILAWNNSLGPKGASQDDWLLNEANHLSSWRELEEKWRRWLGDLICALEQLGELKNDSGLLVLPVDDLDLYARNIRDFLLALRRLYHERLVFLITGDRRHLEEVTRNAYLNDLHVAGLAKAERVAKRDSRWLATALLEKVIPRPLLRPVPPLTLQDALAWDPTETGSCPNGKLREAAGRIQPRRPVPAAKDLRELDPLRTMADLIDLYSTELPGLLRSTWLLWRPFAQATFALGRDQEATFADVMEVIRKSLDESTPSGSPGSEEPSGADPKAGNQPVRGMSETVRRLQVQLYHPLDVEGKQANLADLLQADAALFSSSSTSDHRETELPIDPSGGPVIGRIELWQPAPGWAIDLPVWPAPPCSTPAERLWFQKMLRKVARGASSNADDLGWRYLTLCFALFPIGKQAGRFEAPSNPLEPAPEDNEEAWLRDRWKRLVGFGRKAVPASLTSRYRAFFDELLLMAAPESGLSEWAAECVLDLYPGRLQGTGGGEQRRVERVRRQYEQISEEDAHRIVDAINRASRFHPWSTALFRTGRGSLWWLDVPVHIHQEYESTLGAVLLDRRYDAVGVVEGQGAERMLAPLFRVDLSDGRTREPHSVTNAFDAWLRQRPDSLARLIKPFERTPVPTPGGAGLILEKLFSWMVAEADGHTGDDQALRSQVLVPLLQGGKANVSEDGLHIEFDLPEEPTWTFPGAPLRLNEINERLQFREMPGDWRLGVERRVSKAFEDHRGRHPWLNAWIPLYRGLVGVLQSYQADLTPPDEDAYGRFEGLLPYLVLGDGRTALPLPPLRAWIDHELLRIVMSDAFKFATEEEEFRPPGAVARWLVVLYVQVCRNLIIGARVGLLRNGPFRLPVDYPAGETQVRNRAKDLVELAKHARLDSVRAWARQMLELGPAVLDPEAAMAWRDSAPLPPAPPPPPRKPRTETKT